MAGRTSWVGRAWSFRTSAPLVNPDLTIRAEAGVRPVLKLASDARLAEHPSTSLLHFIGGHVTIEGIEFELDAVSPTSWSRRSGPITPN